MDLSTLLLFTLSSSAIMVTPAPITVLVITRGVAQGRRAAFLTVLGSSAGDALQILLVAIGLSTLLLSSVMIFKVIKYAGAAYFVYLGVKMLWSKSELTFQFNQPQEEHAVSSINDLLSPKTLLWQGFLPSVLNPDTTLFFLAFLPQFVDENKGGVAIQMIVLGTIFIVIGLIVYLPIAYFSGSIGSWLRSKEWLVGKLRWAMGIVFITLGIRAALQEESSEAS